MRTNGSMGRKNSVAALKAQLSKQVLSVALVAGCTQFRNYQSGIFTHTCGNRIDHAVNFVGWGKEGSQEYWIMRNSWGAGWGDAGYMRIAIREGQGVTMCHSHWSYPHYA
jgi:C1A family cysteine protease